MVPEPRNVYALQFFFVAAAMLAIAYGTAQLALKLAPPDVTARSNQFSPVFAISTGLLLVGSGSLFRAVESVRRERQRPFRKWLLAAMLSGVLFVVAQTYAVTCLLWQQKPDDESSASASFVAVFAAMHGMHFVIAFLFLCHVTVQALADRYDHEYYWGVRALAWFWHGLGIAWLAILAVMMISYFYSF